ncbi:hypothetical protein BDR26DRAFT_870357 [Obelidium mucronatum]|nr:hypothetical protein BDR26DRAFT_870357 [Obelidium mucronatum]
MPIYLILILQFLPRHLFFEAHPSVSLPNNIRHSRDTHTHKFETLLESSSRTVGYNSCRLRTQIAPTQTQFE